MRKIRFTLIGLLVLSQILSMSKDEVLFSVPSIHAQSPDATPISQHYVQEVLDRVDAGMENLPGGTSELQLTFFDWLGTLSSAMLELVDTKLDLVEQQRNMRDITPCLHFDLTILQKKIEELRGEMRTAFENGRVYDIAAIQEMIRFLNERYRNLLYGARDIHYVDSTFNRLYSFEENAWCCPQGGQSSATCELRSRDSCRQAGEGQPRGLTFDTLESCAAQSDCTAPDDAEPQELACPFDSDYLPPTVAGYGCDLTVLQELDLGGSPLAAERDALRTFLEKRDAFLRSGPIRSLGTMTLDMYEAMGKTVTEEHRAILSSPDFPSVLTRTHKRKTGCSLTSGPRREFDPPPLWPEGAAMWEQRGPFSLGSDEFTLMRGLYDLLREWGKRRDQIDAFTLPTEYPPGSPERAAAQNREEGLWGLERVVRDFMRKAFREWNIERAGKETLPVAQAGDTAAQMAALTSSLRGTMKNFYELSSRKNRGVRMFAANFGFFLRRTCIYRPCNVMLDRMLKITFEDTCFPYASGLYADDTNIAQDVCKEHAGVDEWQTEEEEE